MNLMDLAEISARTNIPVGAVREYRDRFMPYIPSVRVGRELRFPQESIGVFKAIDGFVRVGASTDAIENELSVAFPVTVICSEPIQNDPGRHLQPVQPPVPTPAPAPVPVSPPVAAKALFEAEFGELRELIAGLQQEMRAVARPADITTLRNLLTTLQQEVRSVARPSDISTVRALVEGLQQEIRTTVRPGDTVALRAMIEELQEEIRAATKGDQKRQGQLLETLEGALGTLAEQVVALQEAAANEIVNLQVAMATEVEKIAVDFREAVHIIREEQHRGLKAIRDEHIAQQERHRKDLATLTEVLSEEIQALRFDLQRTQYSGTPVSAAQVPFTDSYESPYAQTIPAADSSRLPRWKSAARDR